MATGKSAVGRDLAERLNRPFLDSDTVIETQTGQAIAQIFAEAGEPAFRELEKKFVETMPTRGHIIACGGGLPIIPGLMDELKKRGIVIALRAELQTIMNRTRHNRERPLLEVEDPETRVRAMMAERLPIYEQAHATLLSSDRPVRFLADEVLAKYEELLPSFPTTP